MKDKLKKCPFCAWPAALITRKRTKENLPYAPVCTSPLLIGCILYCGYDYRKEIGIWDDVITWFSRKDDAINTWNRRQKIKKDIK